MLWSGILLAVVQEKYDKDKVLFWDDIFINDMKMQEKAFDLFFVEFEQYLNDEKNAIIVFEDLSNNIDQYDDYPKMVKLDCDSEFDGLEYLMY